MGGTYVPVASRLTVSTVLIAAFGLGQLWALPPQQQPQKLIVQRSAESVPDRFSVTPTDVTLVEKQAQRFQVINSKGDTVAVHWSVSGLDCSGSACGTVDDDGNYLAPPSLPRAMTVVLEGTLVQDPQHSVLTRVQLVSSLGASANTTGAVQTFNTPVTQEGNTGFGAGPPPQSLTTAASYGADVRSKSGTAVTYNNGQLTINAQNTTLAAVLKLVSEKTGAVIDLPPSSGLEPVVEHAGPGPANDVITQLLNGSHLNFVIISSPQHPNEPERVVLSLRGEDAEVAKTVPTPPVPGPPVLSPPVPAAPDNAMPPTAMDSILTPPKEQLTPEALGDLMKEKARQIREQVQRENPPQ